MIPHWIDGHAVASDETFDTVDPWTRAAHDRVALGGRSEVDAAVGAARRAFDTGPWPRMGFGARGELIHRFADLIMEHSEELAEADSKDMGKPLSDMRAKDVPRAAQNFRFFADHARITAAETYPSDTGHHAYSRYEPAGVVAAIAPWNFPLMLESWKVAPALAWGNTVVLKPAEDTPSSATIIARLATEAGIPDGVLNVVQGFGPDSAGQLLVEHEGIDRITFTGESGTGRIIAAAGAASLTPVSLELGGKGANIVFADADLDEAVAWSNRAIFTNAGQVCLAGSRLFVQREIFDDFADRFVASAQSLVVGDPAVAGTEIGPLASKEHFTKVAGFFSDLPDAAVIRCGGVADDGSWVVHPTVITGAPPDARVVREEVFGPVVTVTPFDTEDEAVAAANSSRYGLNAMLFTENLRRAHRVAGLLRAGTVWVNCFFVRDLRRAVRRGRLVGGRSRGRQLQPRVLHRAQGHRDATLIRARPRAIRLCRCLCHRTTIDDMGRLQVAAAVAATSLVIAAAPGCATAPAEPPFEPLHLAATEEYIVGVAADVYLPDEVDVAPVVVTIPGGAWVSVDRTGLGPLADRLAGNGIVVVNATHRPAADGARFPAPLRDVVCSVDFAVERSRAAGVEPDQVVVLGHSSGAHLAVLAALAADRFRGDCPYPPAQIDALVGLAGLYDVFEVADVAWGLFGSAPEQDPDTWREGSPATWLGERARLPVFLAHGELDDLVPASSTEDFAAALVQSGHLVEVDIVTGAGHDDIYAPEAIAPALEAWIAALPPPGRAPTG